MRILLVAALCLLSATSSGCYYGHLASGQLRLLMGREPIAEVIANPETDAETRRLLELVIEARVFAREIGLSTGQLYTSYVDWPGDRIVTTLVRAPRTSVEAIPFWFPIVGELPYKGYFNRERAEDEAERIRRDEDLDVCVSGVAAYSTLGWIDDPVTSPMLQRGAAMLIETLLHELVHATAFVDGQVDFNESVAQFIGQEAALRFFARRRDQTGNGADAGSGARLKGLIWDRRLVAEEMIALRTELSALKDPSLWPHRRALAEQETRRRLSELPLSILDPERVASKARLNNACLALRGTYVRDLPRHDAVLKSLDGDLTAMIDQLSEVAAGRLSIEDYYGLAAPASDSAKAATPSH